MKNIWIYFLGVILIASCNDPYKNSTFQVYDINPISTYLSSRPDDFSEWVSILEHANLYNALNQAGEDFTAFVPNNEAVKKFLSDKGFSSITDMDVDYTKDLVRYHIINGGIPTEEFIEGGRLPYPTVSDDYLTVDFGLTGGMDSVFVNNEARVVEFAEDSLVSNGYVYVLGSVLTPLIETHYDRLVENDDYSIFREAVELTKWNERLSKIYDTTLYTSGYQVITKRNFTMFVVPNEIFAKDGIFSINDLISKVGAGSDYTNDNNLLKRYVGYHLLTGTRYEEDLFNYNTADSLLHWTTNSQNDVIATQYINGKNYINYDKNTGLYAQLIQGRTDLSSKNGVYHELSYYLPIWVPSPIEIIWDLTDYDDVANWANEYGGENYEGGGYRKVIASEQKIPLNRTEITSYRYQANSTVTSSQDLYALTYMTGKTGSAWANATNSDALVLYLGYMGWVEMDSPVILKGRYKVEMQYWYATSQKFLIESTGSRFQVSFDGKNSQEFVLFKDLSGSPALNVFRTTMYDEIEFTENESHTFRIVILDPVASSNGGYRAYLDHIRFIPID